MPILAATGAVADVICAVCQAEQHVVMADWITTDEPDMFAAPPCPGCGSQEWFSFHDWTYVGPDGEPDPAHDGARQMVLIERVAQAKGLSRRRIEDQAPGKRYAEPPRAPTQNEVRAYVERFGGTG